MPFTLRLVSFCFFSRFKTITLFCYVLLTVLYCYILFSLNSYRAFGDEKKARLGIGECVNHELMIPYQVLYEKDGRMLLF